MRRLAARWLHLEARCYYEALDTGSARVGYNFSGGDRLTWQFRPMIGGVFGDTTGIGPRYKGSLPSLKLELYNEAAVVDSAERDCAAGRDDEMRGRAVWAAVGQRARHRGCNAGDSQSRMREMSLDVLQPFIDS